jgi:DNA-binding transcriptional MerR regulator
MKKQHPPQKEIPDKLYFKIGEVSDIADVPTSVLRFWESEFSRIHPKRTASGQRLYRKQDIELILKIKDLLYGEKYTIQGAKRFLRKPDNKPAAPLDLQTIRTELEHIRDLLTPAAPPDRRRSR